MSHSVIRSALSIALLAPLSLTLIGAGAPSATAATGSNTTTLTTKSALSWGTDLSSVRVAPGSKAKKQSKRLRAVSSGPVRVYTPVRSVTARSQSFTVWLRVARTQKVRVRAVTRDAWHRRLAERTVTVRPGAWRKVTLKSNHALSARKIQVRVRVAHVRRGETLSVAGSAALKRTVANNAKPNKPSNKPSLEVPSKPAGKLSNGCDYSPRGLPSCGAYLGMAYGSNSDPSAIESQYTGRLGVRRTYYRADQVKSAVATARTDLAKGRLPWISFKFPKDWKSMANGAGDAWARDIAKKLSALPGPVWVAFHHEPENDGVITDWTKAQERLAPIVRKEASNVAYTVVLTGWHQFYGPSEFSLDKIWPKTKVDVAGFDIYNSHGVVKNGKTLKATDMRNSYFTKIEAWSKKTGVPWGLAETGFTDKAVATDPNWIGRTHKELDAHGGVAMAYFNTTLNSIAPWNLNSTAKKDSYRAAQVGTPRLPLP